MQCEDACIFAYGTANFSELRVAHHQRVHRIDTVRREALEILLFALVCPLVDLGEAEALVVQSGSTSLGEQALFVRWLGWSRAL